MTTSVKFRDDKRSGNAYASSSNAMQTKGPVCEIWLSDMWKEEHFAEAIRTIQNAHKEMERLRNL